MEKYDKIFNSVETNEQKYQLASGYISTTTVLFENEGIAARIEAKGDVAFFDVNDYNEEVPMAEINIPEQTGGRQVYEDVLCSVDQDHIILKFPVVKWIDNYPHCDGEHDRWDSVIIGWHRLAFNMKTKNMAVETLE